MDVVEEGVEHLAMRFSLVVARLLATRCADAGHRGANRRAGAAQVEA